MKISILHGDDVLKARARLDLLLSEAKKQNLEIAELNADSRVSEEIAGSRLFPGERLYVLTAASKVSPKELKWILAKRNSLSGTLVVFNEGYLSPKILNLFPKETKIEVFKLPKTIYHFLDAFYPGNSQKCLSLLHGLIQKQPPEYFLALLGRQLRDIYWARVNSSSLPYKEDWRILKLLNQSRKFEKGQVEALIADLAKADVALKTSADSFEGLLDQLIFTHLE